MRPIIKKILVGSVVVIILIVGTLLWAISQVFTNEEVATLTDKVNIEDKKSFIALYRQEMWDGIIWRVYQIKGKPLDTVPSLNAVTKIEGKEIASKFEATGHDGPGPYYLKPNGYRHVMFCSAMSCWEIQCLSTQDECTVN